jgi:hypothetical protein
MKTGKRHAPSMPPQELGADHIKFGRASKKTGSAIIRLPRTRQ